MQIQAVSGLLTTALSLVAILTSAPTLRALNWGETTRINGGAGTIEVQRIGAQDQKLSPQAPPGALPETGRLSGFVRWGDAKLPKPRSSPRRSHSVIPEGMRTGTPSLIVDKDKGMSNVVLYLQGPEPKPIPPSQKTLTVKAQADLWFPHIITARVGQKLSFEFPHLRKDSPYCVHWKSRRNSEWNFVSWGSKAYIAPVALKAEELRGAVLTSDLHPWLESRVFVFAHPHYAVTKSDGSFSIPTTGLKPGRYTLVAWHGRYKSAKLAIEVPKGSETKVAFSFHKNKKHTAQVVP